MNEAKQNKKNEDPAKEEPMYYMENGLMVFTRAYHLKRGYCCQSGCRHCPWGFEKHGIQAGGGKFN